MSKQSELVEKLQVGLSLHASFDITDHLIANVDLIPFVIDLVERQEHPVSNKAAWVLSNFARLKIEPVMPFFDRLVWLSLHAKHQGIRRECIKILKFMVQKLVVSESRGGTLVDLTFEILERPVSIAEKHYCLEILDFYLHFYPELTPEYKSILELNYMQASGPFKARISQRLEKLKQK